MILLKLFWGFLRVGMFSFGGAYTAIPLIRDIVFEYSWLTDEELADMIAVGESTPGPIMVNLATYVGSVKAGLAGAAVATFAVVLPPFVVILLVMVLFRALLKNEIFRAALDAMKPCICGIILATGAHMVFRALVRTGVLETEFRLDVRAVVLTALLAAVLFLPDFLLKDRKKQVSPVLLILISAGAGALIWGFFP